MTPDEQLRQLAEQGLSDPAIAKLMSLSARTVLRRRHRLGIGSEWKPPLPPHGTASRYGLPHKCRCAACRRANTEAHTEWRDRHKRATTPSPNAGASWTAAEDDAIRSAPEQLSTAALARQLGRSYDATRKRRDRLRQEEAS